MKLTDDGSFAAESDEASVAVPVYRGMGRPWKSIATIVTGTDTPIAAAFGSTTKKPAAIGAATTSVVAVAEIFPAAPPRAVTVWLPGVENVTRAVARPFTNETEAGNVAAGSELVSVAVPLKPWIGRLAASTAVIDTFTVAPASTRRGTFTMNELGIGRPATDVDAVAVMAGSASDVTFTDCVPAVSNVTLNDARPFLKLIGMSGKFAAVSLLETATDPVKARTGRPAESIANAVTGVGTPARACGAMVSRSPTAATGLFAVVALVALVAERLLVAVIAGWVTATAAVASLGPINGGGIKAFSALSTARDSRRSIWPKRTLFEALRRSKPRRSRITFSFLAYHLWLMRGIAKRRFHDKWL
jgi:hypothetical protein